MGDSSGPVMASAGGGPIRAGLGVGPSMACCDGADGTGVDGTGSAVGAADQHSSAHPGVEGRQRLTQVMAVRENLAGLANSPMKLRDN